MRAMASVSVVCGLGWGDEGKGSTVEFLCREKNARLVVRFNGGAQAGHNVVTDDGRHHCFAQWGAGTFAGARTFLSDFMLVNPIFAFSEAKHLEAAGVKDPLRLLVIDEHATITTPFHVAANRLRELARGNGRHGSCGMGIGETVEDMLGQHAPVPAWMLKERGTLYNLLWLIQKRKRDQVMALDLDRTCPTTLRELEVLTSKAVLDTCVDAYGDFAEKVSIVDKFWLDEQLDEPGHIVFEGAQGVLLDENWGFHPHTTWSTCTFDNAKKLLGRHTEDAEYLGVLRTFATRHGAGPFPTERADADHLAAGDHNSSAKWQGDFRVGAFDGVLASYAASRVPEMTGLVLTHLDRLEDQNKIGNYYAELPSRDAPVDLGRQEKIGKALAAVVPSYDRLTRDEFPEYVSSMLCTPLRITSSGATAAYKKRIR